MKTYYRKFNAIILVRALTDQPQFISNDFNYVTKLCLMFYWFFAILIVVYYKSKLPSNFITNLDKLPTTLQELYEEDYQFYDVKFCS